MIKNEKFKFHYYFCIKKRAANFEAANFLPDFAVVSVSLWKVSAEFFKFHGL